jgi:PAS domain S-box-containing protein
VTARLLRTPSGRSENKYRNLFDYATDAIFVQSLGGDILSVNNEACRLLNFAKEELYRRKLKDLIAPEHKPFISEVNSKLRENGSHRFETQYLNKEGKPVDVEVSMRLIRLLDEDVVQAFVRDITDRKRSQKEISMLAHAVKSISECVSITDLNNKLIFVNDAFVKTFGYRGKIIGKSMNIVRSQRTRGLYEIETRR